MRVVLIGFALVLVAVSPVRADVETDKRVCVRAASPQASIAACTRLLNSGRFGKASMAIAYYNRGVAYLKLKQYRQAIADYGQVIRLNPKFVFAYFNRGIAYHRLKQYRQAIADYDQAIRLNPRNAKVYNSRGAAYAGLKQYRQAIADCDQAIRLNPKYARAYYNRGVANRRLKRHRQAIADYRAAYKLQPWNSQFAAQLRGMGVKP